MKLQKLFGPVSLKLSHFLLLSILTTPAIAFDSGSTGSDGAFAPVQHHDCAAAGWHTEFHDDEYPEWRHGQNSQQFI